MRPPLTLQWFIDLIGKIPAITCFCLDLSEFESESSAVFLSTLENQRNFLTARNPLLPVELEVENLMKRDMFEFRGISGRKDDSSRMAHITFLIDTLFFFFYDLARPGSKLTLSSQDKICTCKTLQCCGWLNVIIFHFFFLKKRGAPFYCLFTFVIMHQGNYSCKPMTP